MAVHVKKLRVLLFVHVLQASQEVLVNSLTHAILHLVKTVAVVLVFLEDTNVYVLWAIQATTVR